MLLLIRSFSYVFRFTCSTPIIIYTPPFIVIAIVSRRQQQNSRIRIRFIVFITLIIKLFNSLIFLGAKVRRFPHRHNTTPTAFAYHDCGILPQRAYPSVRRCLSLSGMKLPASLIRVGVSCLRSGRKVRANREKGAFKPDSAACPCIFGRTAVYLSANGLICASGR